jgi:tetratricopeptide (TPR) repeat protein
VAACAYIPLGAFWHRPQCCAIVIVTAVAALIAVCGRFAVAAESDVLIYEAMRLLEEKRYERAEEVATQALELAAAERPVVTYNVMISHRLLHNIYIETDRPNDAVRIAEACVEYVKRASGYDQLRGVVLNLRGHAFSPNSSTQPRIEDWHPLPGALRMLSAAYVDVDRGAEAELLARESLALTRALCGVVSSDAAESYETLANAYRSQGRLALAIPALEQAASIYESVGEYIEAADVQQRMADLLRQCGEEERAAKFEYRAALVRRVGGIQRWTNAFPFGSKGAIAAVLGTTISAIWLYRWRRSRNQKR